jgi:transcriptional repressor NrdR
MPMRCPWCGHEDDKVVDSRPAEQGAAIRRRRECRSCARRYTTFERVEELGLMVVKRDG